MVMEFSPNLISWMSFPQVVPLLLRVVLLLMAVLPLEVGILPGRSRSPVAFGKTLGLPGNRRLEQCVVSHLPTCFFLARVSFEALGTFPVVGSFCVQVPGAQGWLRNAHTTLTRAPSSGTLHPLPAASRGTTKMSAPKSTHPTHRITCK